MKARPKRSVLMPPSSAQSCCNHEQQWTFPENHPMHKIMILGQRSSDAFLVYIKPQVLEWTSKQYVYQRDHQRIFCPGCQHRIKPEDPRTRESPFIVKGSKALFLCLYSCASTIDKQGPRPQPDNKWMIWKKTFNDGEHPSTPGTSEILSHLWDGGSCTVLKIHIYLYATIFTYIAWAP